jgi:DNA-nicking Smr family endonuclease
LPPLAHTPARAVGVSRTPFKFAPAAPVKTSTHFVYGGGDPKLDRAAASRRIAIDRTLDLHGMTQAEAHRLLHQFILRAAGDGVRLALIITGKGRPSQPGVLRARFLDWVETPPLKGAIARVAPARPRDGGAGAFYVFLKAKGAGAAPPRL